MGKKKHLPGKPRGMNLAQAKAHDKQVFDELVRAEAWKLFLRWSGTLLQMSHDAHAFAANDVMQMGEKRYKPFADAAKQYVHEMAKMINTDGDDDPGCVYSRAKIDQRMQKISGKHFKPWEVRYGKQEPGPDRES